MIQIIQIIYAYDNLHLLCNLFFSNTKLYHDKDGKKEITVHRVRDLQQAINIYKKGFEMRRTAKTLKNQNSSRSHTICSIFLTKNNENNSKTCSELNLVDLAGYTNISR